ncbi:MAG: aminomethyltransferase beta-barrel domain-containing protein, partial [Ignavibacteriaceae bacterium]
TIGQRSGLGLGGGPWYVVKKDVANNLVFISSENTAGREVNEFNVGKLNWINEEEPKKKNLLIKIRHGANFYNCSLTLNDEGMGKVKLDKPDKGIAAGQFAVFYDGEVCLGGGVIL